MLTIARHLISSVLPNKLACSIANIKPLCKLILHLTLMKYIYLGCSNPSPLTSRHKPTQTLLLIYDHGHTETLERECIFHKSSYEIYFSVGNKFFARHNVLLLLHCLASEKFIKGEPISLVGYDLLRLFYLCTTGE